LPAAAQLACDKENHHPAEEQALLAGVPELGRAGLLARPLEPALELGRAGLLARLLEPAVELVPGPLAAGPSVEEVAGVVPPMREQRQAG